MNVIECQQLKKSFANKEVLKGIDLAVEEKEFFGLVGMNGSGKSTMIKSMLDLASIDSGAIKLFGRSHREVDARENVSYLPDRFSPPPYLKGRDFIQYMLELHGSQCSAVKIDAMLDELELDKDIMNESVSKLSKGMTQKLGLLTCLLSEKSLFVLDEPMSGLDPKARVLFKQQLQKMKPNGLTVFFSSHVLADVDELADRIAVLHHGEILYTGTTEKFKSNYQCASLEDAYMQCISVT